MNDCLFCKIINGEIPSSDMVYEDDKVFALLDINPVSNGHLIVMPKNHSESMLDISDDDASHLIVVVKKLSNAVLKAVGAGGINILSNNKAPAGQIIEHPHIHIVPRFSDDNLSEWQSHKYKVGEKEKYVEKIKSSII